MCRLPPSPALLVLRSVQLSFAAIRRCNSSVDSANLQLLHTAQMYQAAQRSDPGTHNIKAVQLPLDWMRIFGKNQALSIDYLDGDRGVINLTFVTHRRISAPLDDAQFVSDQG
jgi:hypothetical protein